MNRSAWVLLICGLAMPALAQTAPPDDDDDGPPTAQLRVHPNLNGNLEITLEDLSLTPAAWGKMVRDSLGCDWRAGEYKGSGACLKFLRSQRTQVEGRLDLSPLVSALRGAGFKQVSILLDATGDPAAAPGRGWHKEVYKGRAPVVHYERQYYTFTSYADSDLPPAFQVRMGEVWKPIRLAAPLLFVLTGPALLTLVLRLRSRRTGNRALGVVWLSWILTGAWLYWISALSLTDVLGFALSLSLNHMVATLAIGILVYASPPLIAMATCFLMLAPADDEAGRARMLKRLLSQEAAIVVPLGVFLVGGSMFEQDQRVSMTSLPAAYVVYRILSWLSARWNNSRRWSVLRGDLHDRVVQIADLAGAKLKGIVLLGSRSAQEVNAYATASGHIMLTRGLLERLTRREVDAVVAHEAGHLHGNHVSVRTMLFWAYFVVIGPVGASLLGKSGLPSWFLALPILPILYIVVVAQVSQRHEFNADARAVKITGDPEGAMAALARLSRISMSPVDWGGIQGSILSHPSMKQRVLAIADRFGVPHERALAVLANPDVIAESPAVHYRLPAELERGEPLYSASAKANHLFWCSWGTKVALVLLLAAFGVLSQKLVGNQYRAVRLFFACTPLAAWMYLRMANLWDRSFRRSLKRRIGRRIAHSEEATFVGLLPGDRVYPIGGFYDWDLGFLTLTADWLTYNGEMTQFSVRRGDILGMHVEKGPVAWDRAYGVVVRYQEGAFILRLPDTGYSQRVARKLCGRIHHWWRGDALATPAAEAGPFPPPNLPSPERVYPPKWKVVWTFAKQAGMLFGGTLLILACAVPMTMATLMFALVPFAAPLAYLVAVCPLLLRKREVGSRG